MKVGDYVRTDKGEIAKVISIANDNDFGLGKEYNGFVAFNTEPYVYGDVIKSNPNIIDLMEENDFVKIEYFSNRYEKRVTRWFEVDYALNGDFCFENGYCRLNILNGKWSRQDELLTPIIKSIVTKEMYSSVEYRVENN